MERTNKTIREDTLNSLRTYLVTSEAEVNSKEDFKKVYFKMYKEGYFFKADLADALDQVKKVFDELELFCENNKNIIEEDLIFYGARRVIDKMNRQSAKKR